MCEEAHASSLAPTWASDFSEAFAGLPCRRDVLGLWAQVRTCPADWQSLTCELVEKSGLQPTSQQHVLRKASGPGRCEPARP